MIRYIKQRDRSSCGPVAMVNVLKWAGESVTYKNVSEFKSKWHSNTEDYEGVMPESMTKALRNLGQVRFYNRNNVKIKQIDDHLLTGGIIVILFSQRGDDNDRHGHYYLIVGTSGKKYRVVNSFRTRPAETLITRNFLLKDLRSSRYFSKTGHPKAWFIRRVN